jgi:hypothetical protein
MSAGAFLSGFAQGGWAQEARRLRATQPTPRTMPGGETRDTSPVLPGAAPRSMPRGTDFNPGAGATRDVDPRVIAGIREAAAELQMDPVDLASVISYETAGTFDPTIAGPTTQFGQHRGLIQWGEPQTREYGVNWDDPIGSQLGRNGAIVRYFRRNGYQPGMGLEDIYSIVNAGAPGRYNASDAGNGGAPGTVRDKVRDQFGGHIATARRLFHAQERTPEARSIPPAAVLTPGWGRDFLRSKGLPL